MGWLWSCGAEAAAATLSSWSKPCPWPPNVRHHRPACRTVVITKTAGQFVCKLLASLLNDPDLLQNCLTQSSTDVSATGWPSQMVQIIRKEIFIPDLPHLPDHLEQQNVLFSSLANPDHPNDLQQQFSYQSVLLGTFCPSI